MSIGDQRLGLPFLGSLGEVAGQQKVTACIPSNDELHLENSFFATGPKTRSSDASFSLGRHGKSDLQTGLLRNLLSPPDPTTGDLRIKEDTIPTTL